MTPIAAPQHSTHLSRTCDTIWSAREIHARYDTRTASTWYEVPPVSYDIIHHIMNSTDLRYDPEDIPCQAIYEPFDSEGSPSRHLNLCALHCDLQSISLGSPCNSRVSVLRSWSKPDSSRLSVTLAPGALSSCSASSCRGQEVWGSKSRRCRKQSVRMIIEGTSVATGTVDGSANGARGW